MSIVPAHVVAMLEGLRQRITPDQARSRMSGAPVRAVAPLRASRKASRRGIASLWSQVRSRATARGAGEAVLADEATLADAEAYSRNIEAMIGTVKLPVGVVGPLRVNGLNASGDFLVPLATTEAALVASYARGADLISRAGGAEVAVLSEGVLRAPAFVFGSMAEAGIFVDWVVRSIDALKAAAEATTRFGRLVGLEPLIDNDTVLLLCRYTTGDASGQNMVTIATEAMANYILAHAPVAPRCWFIEANYSGDKKASYLGAIKGRGRKVSAGVVLPGELVERRLHVPVERMLDYARVAALGAQLSGQIGAQGHYANGLAALYIATGQDAACVAESAVGFTRMERRGNDLFMSVTLPNLLVGTVGGGTGLPSQAACLELMGLRGAGHAGALAEVAAAFCLAGEISIMAAIAAGHFTRAHAKLARGKP